MLYYDDIVVISKGFKNYICDLYKVFYALFEVNISLKLDKLFASFSIAVILSKLVNLFRLNIPVTKLQAIEAIKFLTTLYSFKHFLRLRSNLRYYMLWYTTIVELLEDQKIILLYTY